MNEGARLDLQFGDPGPWSAASIRVLEGRKDAEPEPINLRLTASSRRLRMGSPEVALIRGVPPYETEHDDRLVNRHGEEEISIAAVTKNAGIGRIHRAVLFWIGATNP
jgi:hypothetical protein